jgi:hypothetical protein
MSEVAKLEDRKQLVKTDKLPDAVKAIINVEAWASAIVRKTPYNEPNPDFIMQMLAFQTITAETVDEVFRQANIQRLQEMLVDEPGATTGPFEVIDLYVAKSDFDTGNPSYVIMTNVDLETGKEYKLTTGATNVQATLIGLLVNGMWPIRAQIKRGDMKDKGGHYLTFLLPPD